MVSHKEEDMPNPITEFIWKKAILKGVTTGVASLLATYGANLSGAGITVDQQALITFLAGLLGTLRNWLKVKQGWTWL